MSHQPSRRCDICQLDNCSTHPAQELELKTWIKDHAKELRKWDAMELAEMAHLCLSWIDKQVINKVIPEAHIDIQTHSTYKLREDYHINRELDHIECRGGKPQLEEQWHHLMHFENGKEWTA